MSITLAAMTTAIAMQYKRALTDKVSETTQAIQYICEDIADHFVKFDGLDTKTSAITVTQHIASVSVATALADLYGRRIRQVSLIDSSDSTNDRTLEEIDYQSVYLNWLPNPASPQNEHYDIPTQYAYFNDYIYFKSVPDKTTYTIVIYFGKIHPTVSGTQAILYPSDFKSVILHGSLWYLYQFVERNDGLANSHLEQYEALRNRKIKYHSQEPNITSGIVFTDL